MKQTGKFIKPDTLKEISDAWKSAMETPVMTFSVGEPDMASVARKHVQDRIQEEAVSVMGSKHPKGCYGLHLETGEIYEPDTGEVRK